VPTSLRTWHLQGVPGGLSFRHRDPVEVDLAKSKFNEAIEPKVLSYRSLRHRREGCGQQENYVNGCDKRDYEAYDELCVRDGRDAEGTT
jgi:hypothetical protein